MENIIYEDSPLAAYLEGASACASTPAICVMSEEESQRPRLTLAVGEGTGEPGWVASVEDDKSDRSEKSEQSQAASFAPRGPSTLQSKLRKKLPRPLKLPHRGSIHRIQSAYSVSLHRRSPPSALLVADILPSAPSTPGLAAPTTPVSSSTSGSRSSPHSCSASIRAKQHSRSRLGLQMALLRRSSTRAVP